MCPSEPADAFDTQGLMACFFRTLAPSSREEASMQRRWPFRSALNRLYWYISIPFVLEVVQAMGRVKKMDVPYHLSSVSTRVPHARHDAVDRHEEGILGQRL